MIITVECPSCETTFPVDPRKVPDGGVKVRCSVCSGIFFVDKPEVEEPTPAPLAAVVAERAAAADEAGDDGVGDAVAVDEDREHIDPWSGAGFDHPSDMGASASEEPADPWSGGMELEDAGAPAPESKAEAPGTSEAEAAFEAASGMVIETEPEMDPGSRFEADSEPPEDAGDDSWVIEQSSTVDFDASRAVEPLETVEQQVRDAAAEHTADVADGGDENPWDEHAVPPAAEAPVESAWGDVHQDGHEEPHVGSHIDAQADTHADAHDDAHDDGHGAEADHEAAHEAEAEWAPPTVETEAEAVSADRTVEADAEPETESAGAAVDDSTSEWNDAADIDESPVEAAWSEASADTESIAEADVTDAEAPAAPTVFQFGRRDPHEKARRLARVLVSDMITYNPERHRTALANGTLHADFEEEIRKSWAEYTEQVGQEMAESTTYWFDALNEILAEGQKVF